MKENIIDFYNNYDEENRLIKDNFHKIEYITNVHYIKKYCPQNSEILDACAGTGRYSFVLAENSRKVTSCDIVPSHIDQIKSKDKEKNVLHEIKLNNVLDMDFPDNSFDVVLCMGALYHLKEPGDQKKAVKECIRILRPNGIIVLSYINKYAQMLFHARKGGGYFETAYNIYKNGEKDIFIGLSRNEIKELMKGHAIETIKNIASDGSAYLFSEQINAATRKEFEIWLRWHFETCEEDSILGNSLHALYIGRKNR
jgi:2-polyprenyl-3-methyl-5-hydroxy-6-metoxy-1,4-benzoquinol methylase